MQGTKQCASYKDINKQIKYLKHVFPLCDQSQTKKPKMLMHYSEMTVNYIAMQCNTFYYTVEYIATNYSSDNKQNLTM